MIRNTLTGVALAAVCAIGVAAPMAQAQTLDLQTSMYEHLLEPRQAERNSGTSAECGSIANNHLRADCIDNLTISADQRSRDLRDGLTGGGHGRMNPIDRTFQGPDMYDPHLGR